MKTLAAFIATAILSISTTSLADISVGELALLPTISNVSVQVNPAPGFAAVEPTTDVKFSFVSCARQTFSADVQIEENVLLVKVIKESRIDCKGPTKLREYSVQIGSSMNESLLPVVVLNPIGSKNIVRIVKPRPEICTMIAGVAYNPTTGHCASFTNGCMLNALTGQGYTMDVPDGACGR